MKPRITSLHVRPKPPSPPPTYKFCAVYRSGSGQVVVHKVNREEQLKGLAATRWDFDGHGDHNTLWTIRTCKDKHEAIWKVVLDGNSFFFKLRWEASRFCTQFDIDQETVAVSAGVVQPPAHPQDIPSARRGQTFSEALRDRRNRGPLDDLRMPELIRRQVADMNFFRRNTANNHVWFHDGPNYEETGYRWYVRYSGMQGEEHFRFAIEEDATTFANRVNSTVLSSRARYP